MAIDDADATRAPYTAPEAALMGAAEVLTRGGSTTWNADSAPAAGYTEFYPPKKEDDDPSAEEGDDDDDDGKSS
jgi:hypothetical protein